MQSTNASWSMFIFWAFEDAVRLLILSFFYVIIVELTSLNKPAK